MDEYPDIKTPSQERAETLYGEETPQDEPSPVEESEEVSQEPAREAESDDEPVAERQEPEAEEDAEDSSGAAEDDDAEVAEQKAADEDDDEQYMTTIEELAEHLETDPDFIQSLKVQQKVNGEMVDVSIADALSTHRKVLAADNVLSEAKEKRNELLAEATKEREEAGERLAVMGTLVTELEQEYSSLIDGADMDRLRQDDPQEWNAKKTELREKQERIESLKEKAAAAYRDMVQSANQKMQEQRLQRLPQEQEILLDRVPEWQDEEKATQERKKVVQYLNDQGFAESEISAAGFSGKALAIAVKAMRYDQLEGKKANLRSKKVVTIPKVTKPGTKSEDRKPQQKPKDRASLLYGP